MPNQNQELIKKAAIVAGCTVVVAGATYIIYRNLYSSEVVDNSAEGLKTSGNKLFQQKKYQQALEKFDQALTKSDDKEFQAICHQNAAACLEKLDRIPESILRCSDAMKRKPTYIKAILRRGNLHALLGEQEECLRDFALVTMIDPQTKQLDKAFKTFEKAHKVLAEQEFADISLQRSQGLDYPIPETSVIEWLGYSVIHDPVVNSINSLHTINDRFDSILSLIKHKKYDLVASAASEESQKDDTEHRLECLYVAAKFYTFHNNPRKVSEWLDKFFAYYETLDEATRESDKVKAYVVAAYNARAASSDSLEQSQEYVDKAALIDPNNTDPRFGYAMLAILLKQLEKAAEALNHVLAIEKDHPYVKFYLNHFDFTKACESQHMSDMHNQIVKMEQLLDQYPKAPIFTYTVLSNIHSNSGNFPLALEILSKGLKAYPDLSEFIMLKTLTEAKCNRSMTSNADDMAQVFIDLCERDPNNFEAQATYGKICSGRREFAKAIEAFERAIMLARQPAELTLAIQELVLVRASREAQYLLETLNAQE